MPAKKPKPNPTLEARRLAEQLLDGQADAVVLHLNSLRPTSYAVAVAFRLAVFLSDSQEKLFMKALLAPWTEEPPK
jgi:hypothetical protein